MEPSIDKPFRLADFRPFLQNLREAADQPVVIGGMAVSAWADRFLLKSEHPKFDIPLYSKDLDLRGSEPTTRLLADRMTKVGAKICGQASATRKSAPHMGRVFAISLIWKRMKTSIEVLERLPGLDTGIKDPRNGSHLIIAGGLCVLDPCSLFICKLHAANTRPAGQSGNDVKHLKMLARVIPRFLEKLRLSAVEGYDGNEDAARLLQLIEDCEEGRNPFQIPLAAEEISGLTKALRGHLR